ncbi:hypothetical protein K501DRAFT_305148 [Backusella circina FSU 941]|nr:hypothetical protein K501DRAFT_305148 [Backusella circina FSU 941]
MAKSTSFHLLIVLSYYMCLNVKNYYLFKIVDILICDDGTTLIDKIIIKPYWLNIPKITVFFYGCPSIVTNFSNSHSFFMLKKMVETLLSKSIMLAFGTLLSLQGISAYRGKESGGLITECEYPGTKGLFISRHKYSYQNATSTCQKLGGSLVDLSNQNILLASDLLLTCSGPNSKAWVGSWDYRDDDYNIEDGVHDCLSLVVSNIGPTGTISKICRGDRQVLCQNHDSLVKHNPFFTQPAWSSASVSAKATLDPAYVEDENDDAQYPVYFPRVENGVYPPPVFRNPYEPAGSHFQPIRYPNPGKKYFGNRHRFPNKKPSLYPKPGRPHRGSWKLNKYPKTIDPTGGEKTEENCEVITVAGRVTTITVGQTQDGATKTIKSIETALQPTQHTLTFENSESLENSVFSESSKSSYMYSYEYTISSQPTGLFTFHGDIETALPNQYIYSDEERGQIFFTGMGVSASTDEEGNEVYLHGTGEPVYTDKNGDPVYFRGTVVPTSTDENGYTVFYPLSDAQQHSYAFFTGEGVSPTTNEEGDSIYVHGTGEPIYTNDKGNHVYFQGTVPPSEVINYVFFTGTGVATSTDEEDNIIYLHGTGEPIYTDKKGDPVYFQGTVIPVKTNSDGSTIYSTVTQTPAFVDEEGNAIFFTGTGTSTFTDDQSSVHYVQGTGNPLYIDQDNEPVFYQGTVVPVSTDGEGNTFVYTVTPTEKHNYVFFTGEGVSPTTNEEGSTIYIHGTGEPIYRTEGNNVYFQGTVPPSEASKYVFFTGTGVSATTAGEGSIIYVQGTGEPVYTDKEGNHVYFQGTVVPISTNTAGSTIYSTVSGAPKFTDQAGKNIFFTGNGVSTTVEKGHTIYVQGTGAPVYTDNDGHPVYFQGTVVPGSVGADGSTIYSTPTPTKQHSYTFATDTGVSTTTNSKGNPIYVQGTGLPVYTDKSGNPVYFQGTVVPVSTDKEGNTYFATPEPYTDSIPTKY